MKRFQSLVVALTICSVTPMASAVLSVNLSAGPGAGETTLTFAGSSTVDAGSASILATDGDNGAWFSFGDYIQVINDTNFPVIGGSATIGVNATFANIDSIYLDNDGDNLDDWGVSILPPSLAFVPGDVISWSGSVVIGVNFSEFNAGAYSTNDFGFGAAQINVNMTVGALAEAIPEPATVGLGLLGLAGLALRRRRLA